MTKYSFRQNILALAIFCLIWGYGCDTDDYARYSVRLNIVAWSLPDSVKVAQNFDLYLKTESNSSCIKKHDFAVLHAASNIYEVYGVAVHESYDGECSEQFVEVDTTFSGQFSVEGRYYFLFLYDNLWRVDSIQVVP